MDCNVEQENLEEFLLPTDERSSTVLTNKAGPHKAGPHKAGPHKAGPHKAGPHKAGPHKAGPHAVPIQGGPVSQQRVIVNIFLRNRYKGAAAPGIEYLPRERQKLAKLMGGAQTITVHCRVYDRSAAATLNFVIPQGCFGDEMPWEAPRQFPLTISGATPTLPWDSTTMPNLPDDGTFTVSPEMGLVDFIAVVAGGANVWVEFELWATLEFPS